MSLDRLSRIRHLKRPSGVFGWEESEERRERVDTPAGEVWRVHSAHSDTRVQHVWMFFVPESLVSLKGVAFVSLLGGWYLGDRFLFIVHRSSTENEGGLLFIALLNPPRLQITTEK